MLNRNDIINATHGGLDIFRHYLGRELRVGRKFRNPFYQDTHASCSLYFDRRSGVYKYRDFGNEDYAGDCFDLVATLHNLSCRKADDFVEILRIINRDLCLGLSDEATANKPIIRPRSFVPEPARKTPTPYKFRVQTFSDAEQAWWKQYGINAETLNRYGVVSLAEYFGISNSGRSYTLRSSPSEPMFGYVRQNGIKVYRPQSQSRFLFGGSFKDYYCFGQEQLPATGDTLFITGGEKDVLSLAAHGFPAICFGSETARIPHKLIEELSQRFQNIVLLYDMDATGKKHALALQQELRAYNVGRLELPLAGTKQEKDISDYFRLGHTATEFRRLMPRPEVRQYTQHKNGQAIKH